jgi:ABC-type transporter Mla MlaB component
LSTPAELDVATDNDLVQQGYAAIDRSARVLLLDLAGLSFCDARGLSAFVQIANHADTAGCRFALFAPLSNRIHAGNSSSTQAVRPTLTSKTTATANPSIPIHLGTTLVRSVMVAVLMVNTAAIRIAYTCSRSEVT